MARIFSGVRRLCRLPPRLTLLWTFSGVPRCGPLCAVQFLTLVPVDFRRLIGGISELLLRYAFAAVLSFLVLAYFKFPDLTPLQRAVAQSWSVIFTVAACYGLWIDFFAGSAALGIGSWTAGITTLLWLGINQFASTATESHFPLDQIISSAALASLNLGITVGSLLRFQDWSLVTQQPRVRGRRLAFAARPLLCLLLGFTGIAVAVSHSLGRKILEDKETMGVRIGACAGAMAYLMALLLRPRNSSNISQRAKKMKSIVGFGKWVLVADTTFGGLVGWIAGKVNAEWGQKQSGRQTVPAVRSLRPAEADYTIAILFLQLLLFSRCSGIATSNIIKKSFITETPTVFISNQIRYSLRLKG